MHHTANTTRRRERGFSLTELLVAISIIALLVGATFPVVSVLKSGSRVEAGLNVVGMSADVARQWVQAKSWANDGSLSPPTLERYSGTAAIYCPTGEIRITRNERMAQDTSGAYLEDFSPEVNGYSDLSGVDYIRIPDGVGVAGIQRFGPGANDVRFIAPPFAIAFNEFGQLNYGDTSGRIYYDGDDQPNYDTGPGRTVGYNPFEWRGYDNALNAAPPTGSVKKELPFDAIECVPGVVVYSTDEFDSAGFDFAGGGTVAIGSDAGNWLNDNGQTLFFSPHTGVALRDESQE